VITGGTETVKKKSEDIKAFLGKGAEFDGKLILSGSVRIDGEFKGDIRGGGTLIVGEGARVEADIAVDNILIFGEVRGNLDIKERVEIGPSGRFYGNLKAADFVVQEGAVFDGDCRMSSKEAETGKEKREEMDTGQKS